MGDDDLGTAERFWKAFNTRDLSQLDGLFSEDYVNHAAIPGTPTGPAGQAQVMQRLWTAFPDARFEIEHLAQDGDSVICIGTMSGTHEGELFSIPGSGRPIAWRQCHIMTVANGRATAHRAIRDDLGLMRQMGALPDAEPACEAHANEVERLEPEVPLEDRRDPRDIPYADAR